MAICGHPGPLIIHIIVYQILERGVNGGGGIKNCIEGSGAPVRYKEGLL